MRIISGLNRGTKLNTLEGIDTRPTLDRVKEALFSKINYELVDSKILDLFSGSGSLALESISRGAKKAYLCDSSFKAINIIKQNIKKTRTEDKTVVLHKDYIKALEELKLDNVKFDIIFLDPPYKTNYNIKSIDLILKYDLLENNGKIIIETDIPNEILSKLEKNILIDIYDVKKYGRVTLIFIRRKG